MAEVETPLAPTRDLVGTVIRPRSSKVLSDHLSTTKSFLQVQKNELISVNPEALHFPGFSVGQVLHTILRITNISGDPQRMHILPPNTPFFRIHYIKKGPLFPGLHLDVKVSFTPKTWAYQYDCIRLHCAQGNTLVVPVHGYPRPDTSKFPHKLNFPPTPLGQSASKSFSLSSHVPVDFHFFLQELERNPAFTVVPTEGVIPGDGKVVVRVTYTPIEYITAVAKLQLDVSQFNWKLLTCTCVGTSTPGLAIKQHKTEEKVKATGTIPLAPLERLKQQRLKKKKQTPLKEKVYQGYRIPANMSSIAAVNSLLNQEPGKLRASELRASMAGSSVEGGKELGDLVRRQIREASFVQGIKDRQDQERSIQYKWVTRLGEGSPGDEERKAALKAREEEESRYRYRLAVDLSSLPGGRSTLFGRTLRRAQEDLSSYSPGFVALGAVNWTRRRDVLVRFAAAARKVLVVNRCLRRLKKIKAAASGGDSGQQQDQSVDISPGLKLGQVVSSVFPRVQGQAGTEWGSFKNIKAVGVSLPSHTSDRHINLLELEVPLECQLLGYQPHPLPPGDGYVLPGQPLPLRTGALEEVEAVALYSMGMPEPAGKVPAQSVQVVDLEEEKYEEEGAHHVAPLTLPPSTLHQLPHYTPLSVFVPCPLMNPTLPVLPHSEVEISSRLLPLPLYPTEDQKLEIMDSMVWREDEGPFVVTVERSRAQGRATKSLRKATVLQTGFMDDFTTLDNYSLLDVNPSDLL